MRVMQERVAVLDLEHLAHAHAYDTRSEDASALVDDSGLSRDGCLRDVSLYSHKYVPETPIDSRDDVLMQDAFAGIHSGAHGIHYHANAGILRHLSAQR